MASQLVFNLASGSVSCGFTPTAASELQAKLKEIVQVLKTKTAATTSGGGGTSRIAHKPIHRGYFPGSILQPQYLGKSFRCQSIDYPPG